MGAVLPLHLLSASWVSLTLPVYAGLHGRHAATVHACNKGLN